MCLGRRAGNSNAFSAATAPTAAPGARWPLAVGADRGRAEMSELARGAEF